MHSIKTRITAMTVCAVVIAMAIAAAFGVKAIRDIGNYNADQTLLLLCETGNKDLDYFFQNVESSVKTVAAFVQSDLDGVDDEALQAHIDRVSDVFQKLAYNTNGVLTYYYRIDPEVSGNVKGFWYVNSDGNGFKAHEVTDITEYDTDDTSSLVWFTVPKATGEGVWLPPYITENLYARVISYNVPVYYDGQFIGVIGIEIDYSTMAEVVNHITPYENGYAFLNDDEGNIIYHPRMDVTTMEAQPQVPSGLLSNDKFIRYFYDGVEKRAVCLPLSNGMRLVVTVPVQEINAAWHKWITEITIVFAVLLVVFVVLIMTFTGRITRPLQKLTKAAEQISEGNYDTELDYDRQDEVGVLTASFKKLIAELKVYIGNLNDTLGHEAGDELICGAADCIMKAFPTGACFRTGGDEFVVLTDDMNRVRTEVAMSRLRREVGKWDGKLIHTLELAAGYALAEDNPGLSAEKLVHEADMAMYEAKEAYYRKTGNDRRRRR